MQKNNGAGGSIEKLIKTEVERFVVSFVVSIKKMAKITSQSCIKIYLNYTTFPLSILQENAFLKNRI